jgi:hypothetical protein
MTKGARGGRKEPRSPQAGEGGWKPPYFSANVSFNVALSGADGFDTFPFSSV